jgi:hypothetical protein
MNLPAELDDETLVAFLDGELPPATASALRQRLEADPVLQQRVDELKSSWQLLDELPPAKPNPQLAQSTIQLVTLELKQAQRQSMLARFQRFRWLMVLGASLSAVVAGWGWSQSQASNFQQSIVDDLPVLTNFRELESIDSPQWLERLAQIENLELVGLQLFQEHNFPPLPKRRKDLARWIDQLQVSQKQLLQRSYRELDSIDQDRQIELKKLATELEDPHSRNAKLIRAYSGLLNTISSTEAMQISSTNDLDQRAKEIEKVIRRELAIYYADQLSESEKSQIVRWANSLKESNPNLFNAEDPDVEILDMIDVEFPDENIPVEQIDQLMQCVNEVHRAPVTDLEPSLQNKVIKLWIVNSLPSLQARPEYSTSELLERFQRLPLQKQNELIYRKSQEVIKTLSEDKAR